MRKLVVVLVSVAVVAGGGSLPLRAQEQHPHRHYLLRIGPADIEAIASRHNLIVERRDDNGTSLYVAASDQDPVALKAEIAADAAVLSFEEDTGLALPETTEGGSSPSLPPAALIPETPAPETPPATPPGTVPTPVLVTENAPEPPVDPQTVPVTPIEPPPVTETPPVVQPAPETAPAPDPPPVPKPLGSRPPLPDTTPIQYFDRTVWRGYVFQPAMATIRADEAHRDFATGAGVIAIIDSGIDVQHPAIAGSFVQGFDFLVDSPTITSDLAAVNQSTATILEVAGSTPPDPDALTVAQVNQSTAVILEQSTAAILEAQTPLPDGLGHGTMVAGLVRLVAPTAKIMPLTVFSADGKGDLYNVVRAIYFAVDHGATVINMSFSLEQWSKELVRALNYAADHDVVCVASAGNGGQETMVFPSGFRNVIGVGSSDPLNRRSLFSNYGKGLVRLFAPGEALVTAFPAQHYALVSGTSFSTALVSGAAALLLQRNSNLDPEDVDFALSRVPYSRRGAGSITPGSQQLRLDLYYALSRVRPDDDQQ
jgi:subtilisin family serine protease